VMLFLAALAMPSAAEVHDRLRVAVGRAEVVTSGDDVRTVAIAEPRIADAAVGSARTVVVNGKSPGVTTLVVYGEGARFKVYDVEVFVPNADKQVLLRVRVAELNDKAKRDLGFDWWGQGHSNNPLQDGVLQGGLYTTKVFSPTHPLTVGPRTDGFIAYDRNNGDLSLQATWRLLEEHGDLRTLASPTLVARSGEKASFLSGGEIPVPIASNTGAGQVTITIEWKEYGVKVDFTPTVLENGTLSLQVAPEVSALDFSYPLQLVGFTVPALITRKTSTTVQLRAGEHLVIGGLKHTEKNRTVRRVPVLGHIPLLGFFFSNTSVDNSERELVVVVSPEVVAPTAELPALPTDKPEVK
jgi:pilus assembly protein CpaC